ncbi:MAG: PDZ domain-containing protein, partial [Saprospiraceae bacterium]|nr:PDZ domain-containing protein [Saprospiraceae bacterium]
MKTIATFITITLMMLLPFCSASLFSQTNTPSSGQPEKRVMISKYTIEPDGSETRETIVKKGKAAEDFDIDAYLKANKADNVQINVRIESTDAESDVVIERSSGNRNSSQQPSTSNTPRKKTGDTRAFFGVEPDQDEDEDEPGLTVQTIAGSAAQNAGLKTNDIILRLDGQEVNEWDDLSQIVARHKAGDQMIVEYSRLGKKDQTTVTLTSRSEVPSTLCEPKGYLGVSELRQTDRGVAVDVVSNSAAKQAGLKNGDVITEMGGYPIRDWEDISDVINSSKPGDQVRIRYDRNGQSMESIANIGVSDIELKMDHIGEAFEKKFAPKTQIDLEVSEKSACLGVYTQGAAMADQQGAEIIDFTDVSAAREAELTTGDVIMSVNGIRVKNHSDLWNEIAKYKPEEKINIEFLRGEQPKTAEAVLKSCRDNSSKVYIIDSTGQNEPVERSFFTDNWDEKSRESLVNRQVITIQKSEEGSDSPRMDPLPNTSPDRALKLNAYRAFPNPTPGQVTVEFSGEAVATIVSLYDLSGRQLFREELNAFNGRYEQQFDLSAYAKG